jgi:hypothetical protein
MTLYMTRGFTGVTLEEWSRLVVLGCQLHARARRLHARFASLACFF